MIRLKRGRRSYAATPRRFVAVVAVVQHLGVGVVDDDGHVGDYANDVAVADEDEDERW